MLRRPRSGTPIDRAMPPPVAYTAWNPASPARPAESPSNTPGATTMSRPPTSARRRVLGRGAPLPTMSWSAMRISSLPEDAVAGGGVEEDDAVASEAEPAPVAHGHLLLGVDLGH